MGGFSITENYFLRTSATVNKKDFRKFKALANLKYDNDPLNNAWQEAVRLFLEKYKNEFIEAVEDWLIFFKNSFCFILYEWFKILSKAFAKPLKLPMLNSLNSILYLNNFKVFFKVKYKYI